VEMRRDVRDEGEGVESLARSTRVVHEKMRTAPRTTLRILWRAGRFYEGDKQEAILSGRLYCKDDGQRAVKA